MRKNYWLDKNPEVEGSCGFRNQEIAIYNNQRVVQRQMKGKVGQILEN